MVKTLLVKLVASNFHVKTFFDRIQESIFHQYILQALSGTPMFSNDGGESVRRSGQLSFSKRKGGKVEQKGEDVVNVDKLYKIKREKVSAWTMGGLIKVIRNSDLLTVYGVLDEEESEGPMVIKMALATGMLFYHMMHVSVYVFTPGQGAVLKLLPFWKMNANC